jgi:hypothetical protein
LQELKSLLGDGDKEGLQKYLEAAHEGREVWDAERAAANWLLAGEGQGASLDAGSMTAHLFGYRQRKPRD